MKMYQRKDCNNIRERPRGCNVHEKKSPVRIIERNIPQVIACISSVERQSYLISVSRKEIV